jgi:hypothetical protein
VNGERALSRGWDIQGGKPDSVRVVRVGEPMDTKLRRGLETHGKGLYQLG